MLAFRILRLAFAFAMTLASAGVSSGLVAIPWYSIDGGGGSSAGGVWQLVGTIGQPDAGTMSGGSYEVHGGYWQEAPAVTAVGEGDIPDAGAPAPQFRFPPVHPNPFNPTTQLAFDLPAAAHVQLRIYNVRGELVTTLLDAARFAGRNIVTWRGENSRGVPVASGVYMVTLEAGSDSGRQRIALVR